MSTPTRLILRILLATSALLSATSLPSLAQQTVVIPVDVTVTGVAPTLPPPISPAVPTQLNNPSVSSGLSLGFEGSRSFNAEVCGGIGDPLRTGIQRFTELTEALSRTTSPAERSRLEREVYLQGLKLPGLVTDDFATRKLALGQSEQCDQLIKSVSDLMKQVADYLGAIKDARTATLW